MKPSKDELPSERICPHFITKFLQDHSTTIMAVIVWYVFSPLLVLFRKKAKWMTTKRMWLLILFSPFVQSIICLVVLLVYFILYASGSLNGFTEFTQFSKKPDVIYLEMLCVPIYAICVVVLFVVMWISGWTYQTASVYVCEYAAPIISALVALSILIIMITHLCKLSKKGRLLMLLPISIELYMVFDNIMTYIHRRIAYKDMSIDGIFNYVVDYLLEMAREDHTNYILANMKVYILPLYIILITGYIGKVIYRRTKQQSIK